MATRRRGLTAWLLSPRVAIGLMFYLGVVSLIGTLVSQGSPSDPKVVTWAAGHRQFEVIVRALGLHHAYTSPLFLAGVALLVVSTSACAWRRSRVAWVRAGLLRLARSAPSEVASALSTDATIPLAEGRDRDEAIAAVESALGKSGLRTRRFDRAVVSASPPLLPLASPLFHWSLVSLIVVLTLGALGRSEGLMGVSVGESKPDVRDSYGVVSAGPMHSWPGNARTIGVEELKLSYVVAGLDRGPAPVVIVKNAWGRTLARQVVYPNRALHAGALTVHPNAYGLSATFALIGADGREIERSTELLDFADSQPSTLPRRFDLNDASGRTSLVGSVRILTPTEAGRPSRTLPASPTAEFEFSTAAGTRVTGGTIRPGQEILLPDGARIRLIRIGYYARLSVVDDWTIPLVYAALAAGLVGLAIALTIPLRLVVVSIGDSGEPRADVTVRLWRNNGVTREQVLESVAEGLNGMGENTGHER